MKILLVDDSEPEHFLYKLILENSFKDAQILSAYDGQEALEIWREHTDIKWIFLDINMPGMNGFEFLEEFSKSYKGENLVVMMTSSTKEEDKQTALKYDCVYDYILKPLSEDAFKKYLN